MSSSSASKKEKITQATIWDMEHSSSNCQDLECLYKNNDDYFIIS